MLVLKLWPKCMCVRLCLLMWTLLYVSSTKFTRLSMMLRLMNLKATNGWTDTCFIELLVLLNEMLLDGNTLPTCNYDAKKISLMTSKHMSPNALNEGRKYILSSMMWCKCSFLTCNYNNKVIFNSSIIGNYLWFP